MNGVYQGASGTATGDASVGTDTFSGVSGANGSLFDDTFIGSDNPAGRNESFRGNGGNDFIDGRGGLDVAEYNFAEVSGIAVNLAVGTVTGDISTGTDTLRGVEIIVGTEFADTFDATGFGASSVNAGSSGNWNQFQALGGDDVVTGNGNTQLYYGSSASSINVVFTANNAGYVDGTAVGHDVFTGVNAISASNYDSVIDGRANTSNLWLAGGNGADTLYGGAGGDNLSGGRGADLFASSAGDDYFYGNTSTVRTDGQIDYVDYRAVTGLTQGISVNWASGLVVGQAGTIGTDHFAGIEGIYGTGLDDTFDATGYTGASSTSGDWSGYQIIRAGGGNDTIIGNFNTEATYSDATTGIVATMTGFGTGTVTGGGIGTDSLVGVNRIIGSLYNDTFNGVSGHEIFDGGSGGNDVFNGGVDNDRVEYDSRSYAISVNLAAGTVVDRFSGTQIGTDTLRSIEEIRGSEADDLYDATGFGASSANAGSRGTWNQFEGMGGNDTVTGNGNTQLIYWSSGSGVNVVFTSNGAGYADGTSSGHDTFTGVNNVGASSYDSVIDGRLNTSSLTLGGGNGNDTLYGGSASDILSGGAAADSFVFGTAFGASNIDTIQNLSVSDGDSIKLASTFFSGLAAGSGGQLAASAFAVGTATGSAAQVVYNTSTGALFYDGDGAGAGAATQFATLTTPTGTIDHQLFWLI